MAMVDACRDRHASYVGSKRTMGRACFELTCCGRIQTNEKILWPKRGVVRLTHSSWLVLGWKEQKVRLATRSDARRTEGGAGGGHGVSNGR